CPNNLKQVRLALNNYRDSHRTFPFGEGRGNPWDPALRTLRGCCWGTWQMLILPFIEQEHLARQYVNLGGSDLTGPRYSASPNLQNVTSKRISLLTCPSDTP